MIVRRAGSIRPMRSHCYYSYSRRAHTRGGLCQPLRRRLSATTTGGRSASTVARSLYRSRRQKQRRCVYASWTAATFSPCCRCLQRQRLPPLFGFFFPSSRRCLAVFVSFNRRRVVLLAKKHWLAPFVSAVWRGRERQSVTTVCDKLYVYTRVHTKQASTPAREPRTWFLFSLSRRPLTGDLLETRICESLSQFSSRSSTARK